MRTIRKVLNKAAVQNYVGPQFCSLSAFLKQIGFVKAQEMVAIAALAFVCELEMRFSEKDTTNQKRRA
ncbi:MAG: hypothetical protein II942_01480 [Alphaproteobacteria bacterium]|nr:hypothetical protein [Alphaproteobacteria bacterium]